MNYLIDDESGLYLNYPAMWTKSPYLGAVSVEGREYFYSQICIPNEVWEKIVNQNQNKWRNLPKSIYSEDGATRLRISIPGFSDPRQAAWLTQSVLYSDDNDAAELIEDYLEMKYLGGLGDLWNELFASIPEFEGSPLTENDLSEKYSKEEIKKAKVLATNIANYEKRMKFVIKGEFDQNEIKIDFETIDYFGIDYFVTRPGATKLRPIHDIVI